MKDYLKMKIAIKLLPLAWKLGVAIIVASFLLVIVVGIVQIAGDDSASSSSVGSLQNFNDSALSVSEEVEQYRDLVNREAELNNIGEYTNLILALMMQESGGSGSDPMQASESFCGGIGCISDPEISIMQGVKYFKSTMEQANYDVKLGLQSYNFGSGFISYVLENGGEYTKELAISFSQMMYDRLKHTGMYRCHRTESITNNACYGDIGYVDAVMKYLPDTKVNENGVSISLGSISSPLAIPLLKNSPYGWRIHPIFHTAKLHSGVDLDCTIGDSIHAVKEGVVVKSDSFGQVMLGEYVKIQHSPTDFTTYGHMSSRGVTQDQTVEEGEYIGACGSTGYSTGAHLHFEIHSSLWGGYVDPSPSLGI